MYKRESELFICSRTMYTESVTSWMTKLYISQTHNKHAGPYTCAALDQLQRTVVDETVTLLLYSKAIIISTMFTASLITTLSCFDCSFDVHGVGLNQVVRGLPAKTAAVARVNSAFHPSGVDKSNTSLSGWG